MASPLLDRIIKFSPPPIHPPNPFVSFNVFIQKYKGHGKLKSYCCPLPVGRIAKQRNMNPTPPPLAATSTTTSTINLSLPYHHHHHLVSEDLSTANANTKQLAQKAILDILNTECNNSLHSIKQVHAVVLRSGLFQDHYVSGTLVKCYANPQLGDLDLALKVFHCVPSPNVFVFNAIIKVCLENSDPFKAIELYGDMLAADSRPNRFTYPTLFRACAAAQATKEGLQVHAHLVKQGFSGDGHIKSAGIQMYANFRLVMEARRVLDGVGESDVVCHNAMIDGYFKCGDVEAAKELFESMRDKNIGSWNAMITGLAKCGVVCEARELFNDMQVKDEITWSAMIDGYVKGGCYKEALEVFGVMQREEIRPSKFALSSVLAACANLGALDQGRWVHAYLRKKSIKLDSILGTALVDMYAKCGRLDMAWDAFEKMRMKEVFTWNAMISGLALNGRAEEAIEFFFKMLRGNFRPNGITFVGVLNACAHSGMVGRGLEIFHSMKKVFDVEPEMEHYGCLVDLLGRAGRLAEAEDLILSMPMEPSAAVWGALLGACRKHGDVELGERVGKILLELEPLNSGRYALLSNIYAKAGRWDDAADVRKLMKERGVKTTPGSSVIELEGIVHEFKMGDGSHPRMKEIYLTLKSVIERLETEGYLPNTSQVLFDIDEEEQQTSLKYHSEKLAIAFGLISTKPGTTIRIVKNLRVCEDCHSATKLISQVYNREIIVRDRVRYHHFRNGMCSCNDFW